jgi:hypothetical protein
MLSQNGRRFLFSIYALIQVIAISRFTAAQISTKPIARLTATTDNVSSPGQAVRIELFAWSTDADRDEFVKAWVSPPKPAPIVAADAAPAGGRGSRGGRGGGGGGDQAAPPPPPTAITPAASLGTSLKKAPSVGMLWTSETVGYSIRYAYRLTQPDGVERIILATDRRLGAWNNSWKPIGGSAVIDYPFSIIEIRLNGTGLGEGKASLTTPISVDSSANAIALDNYASSPVLLKAVKKQSVK